MLRTLFIKNLAIIQQLEIEFDSGFNVFTGQTGAGKSMVIGALAAILGFRTSPLTIRPNEKEAVLVASFDISAKKIKKELSRLEELPLDDDELVIQRKFSSSGKTSTSVNAQPVSTATLKQIGEILVDIHGQHENQYLLKPAVQMQLLDEFAGTIKLAEEFENIHHQWRNALSTRQNLSQNSELRRQQLELYEFQLNEIDQANIKPNELETIEAEHRKLSNIEKLREIASGLIRMLEEDEFPLLDQLRQAFSRADQLSDFDPRLKNIPKQINSAILELDDVAKTVNGYVDDLEANPDRLRELDERLALLDRLAKKYGNGIIDRVLSYRDEIAEKVSSLKKEETNLSGIDTEIAKLSDEREKIGKKLSDLRKKSADKLASAIHKQLEELAMPLAKFSVEFSQTAGESPSPHGLETIEFMIQTNPGQPALPLRKIASAGELSRIMLGIKSVLASPGRSSVLVFDEVDSNVGGRLGEVIGKKIAKLATQQQILCISHLPQLATFADRHFVVEKQSSKNDTISSIKIISGKDRIHEIAEMISGQKITDTTIKQAEEMLSASAKILSSLQKK